ncbi:Hypothetical protein HVR_LOCUS532 [uncultured virus]|nr:Hypothetical protein HVR_LOCUS532 [uncultured virus]
MDTPTSSFEHKIKFQDSFNNRHVIVITDLEPDDIIAITLLLKRGNILPENLSFIVSAWKDVNTKARYLRKLLTENFLNYANTKIYLGEASNAKHVLPFALGPEEIFPRYRDLNWYNSFIINLAPVRELIALFREDFCFFRECSLAIYGSFNIRSVIWSDKIKLKELYQLFDSFDEVIYYETFLATGEKNSISDKGLLDIIWTRYPFISELIEWWNKSICKECEKNCAENDPTSDKYLRSKKILDNITEETRQFVNADTGLISILLMDNVDRFIHNGNIRFDPENYYTSLKPSGIITNIKLIKGPDGSLYNQQLQFFTEVLSQ